MTSYPVGNDEFPMVPGQFSKEDISETLYTKFQPCTPKCMFLPIWTSTIVCLGQNKIILQDAGGWRWSLKYAIAGPR